MYSTQRKLVTKEVYVHVVDNLKGYWPLCSLKAILFVYFLNVSNMQNFLQFNPSKTQCINSPQCV